MTTSLRDLVGQNPPLLEANTPAEAEVHSCLPGQDDPSEHVLERLFPTGRLNLNPKRMKALYEAGEISEREVREWVAHTGESLYPEPPPLPDRGGETQPYTGILDDGYMPEAPASSGKRFPVIKVDT